MFFLDINETQYRNTFSKFIIIILIIRALYLYNIILNKNKAHKLLKMSLQLDGQTGVYFIISMSIVLHLKTFRIL